METELLIKIIITVIVFTFLIIRSRFVAHRKFSLRPLTKWIIVSILFAVYWGGFLDFSQVELNIYTRIIVGLFLTFLGGFLFFWAHIHLGKNWSVVIEKKFPKSKTLVKTGLYKRIRHPIYSATFIVILGMGAFTANILLFGIPLIIFLILYFKKVSKEEKSLLNSFGQKYRDYMKQIWRLFPKFNIK